MSYESQGYKGLILNLNMSWIGSMVQPDHPRLTLIGTYKTILEEQTVSYMVKLSSRARNVRFEVHSTMGLTVVIPHYYNIRQLPDLLKEKKHWILDKLNKCRVQPHAPEKELKGGDSIPYLGQHIKVIERCNPGAVAGIRLEQGQLFANLDNGSGRLNLAVERWYKQEAERFIKKRADELCPRLGVTYGRLRIRGAKTRWGSCSQKGNINFNWKLMMVPEPVIDYVIIHELAHLKVMNHSKKFWNLVTEHCPLWHTHRKWLKEHNRELSTKVK